MGESTEHVGVSLIPPGAQEWCVSTEAPHDRLDLRGALGRDQLLPWGPLLSWDSLDYLPSGGLWPGQDLIHPTPFPTFHAIHRGGGSGGFPCYSPLSSHTWSVLTAGRGYPDPWCFPIPVV